MRPIVVNGETWRVVRVPPDDPLLVDRTRVRRVATADPSTRTIRVSTELSPPLLDRVMIHEVAHAITMSYGLLDVLSHIVPPESQVQVEEWAVGLVETYGMEATALASEALGRAVCVRGYCDDRLGDHRA